MCRPCEGRYFLFDDAYVLFSYFVLLKGVFYCNNMTRLRLDCEQTLIAFYVSPGGLLPYMGYIGTCRGIGFGF